MNCDENVFAAFSGGRSSAVMVAEMIRRGAPPSAVIFCNTGMESDATLDFIQAVHENIIAPSGIPLHCIEFCYETDATGARKESVKEVTFDALARNGEPMLAFAEKKGVPTIKTRLCTQVLKIEASGRFILKKYGLPKDNENKNRIDDYIKAVGLRADETSRVEVSNDKNAAYFAILAAGRKPRVGLSEVIMPLVHYGIDRAGVKKIISGWGNWAKIAKTDAHLSNCVGCFNMRGNIYNRAAMFHYYPKHGELWIKLESAKPATKTFPHAAAKIHRQNFCGELPAELHKCFMSNPSHGFWRQAQMIYEQGDNRFTLPLKFTEPPKYDFSGSGCMTEMCGTDL